MNTDFYLESKDSLTELTRRNGIDSWNELTEFVRNLPYGRNSNRTDLGLVLTEGRGTCSSKHALLKRIADSNNILNIDLVLGIYRMNVFNTPKIGRELINNRLEYIPEAHCYLKINGERVDFTSRKSAFKTLEKDIIQEKLIEPEQVATFKVDYHQAFIKNWLKETNAEFKFEQIWEIRERCIEHLANNT